MLKALGYNASQQTFGSGNVFEDAHNGTIVTLDRNCLMEKQEFIAKAKEFVQRHTVDKSQIYGLVYTIAYRRSSTNCR